MIRSRVRTYLTGHETRRRVDQYEERGDPSRRSRVCHPGENENGCQKYPTADANHTAHEQRPVTGEGGGPGTSLGGVMRMGAHRGGLRGIAFPAASPVFYAVSRAGRLVHPEGNELRCWDLSSRKQVWGTYRLPRRYGSLAVSPDGSTLLIGTRSGLVEVWELE